MCEEGTAKKCVLGKCDFVPGGVPEKPMACARAPTRTEHIPVSYLASGPGCEHSSIRRKSTGGNVCDVHVLCTLQIYNTCSVAVFL